MDKVGRPRGLIAYDTVRNLEAARAPRRSRSACSARAWSSTLRAMVVVGLIMLTALDA